MSEFLCLYIRRPCENYFYERLSQRCVQILFDLTYATLKSDFKSTEVVVLAILLTMINALKISRSLVYLPYRV